MCGIVGIISNKPVDEIKIRNASECLRLRGPEGEGMWMSENRTVALAHRRLKIIDLSDDASQPMHYLNRYVISYNGEIYNFPEIKEGLKKKGYIFHSASDTEVIAAAYDAYAERCLHFFDGMFVFGIWDKKEQKLILARDRFGEKPVYFFNDENRFLFASEMKSLWQLDVSKEVNESLLYNFLTIDYTTNPGNPKETFYKNIFKLPAASYLIYEPNKLEISIEKYWQIHPEVDDTLLPEEAVRHFSELLTTSIKKRLRSDVPVGTSLSGGLDSSTIVALCDQVKMQQYSHKCFTAIFNDYEKNEFDYASSVANQFNLQLYPVSINDSDVPDIMNKVMQAQEEPVTSASALIQYAVYNEASKNGIKVLLDGQGADETLAGYHKYYKWYWQELYRNRELRKSKEIEHAKALGIQEQFRMANRLTALLPDFMTALHEGRKSKKAASMQELSEEFRQSNKKDFYYTTPVRYDLNGFLYFNTFVIGLEELLRFADRNSMANGVEVRLPFLSHELVNFIFTLPAKFKIREGWTKWILRKAAEPYLPGEIVWRKDKIGFEPPQKKWMQDETIQSNIQEAKKKLVGHGVLDKHMLHKKITPHDAYVLKNNDWKYWSASFLYK